MGFTRLGVTMVLEKLRKNAGQWLMPITKSLVKVSPNTITWLSLFFAILAGISVYFTYKWPYAILIAFFFGVLNSICDLVDGDLARLTGKTSVVGDFLDHTFDRYADIAMILGMVLSPLCSVEWGVFAISGVLLVSYMGTQAQAMGVGRIYGGLLGRADRLTILGIVGIGEFLFQLNPGWSISTKIGGITVLSGGQLFGVHLFTIAMMYFAVAGHYTAIYRGVKTYQYLKKREKKDEKKH